MTPFRLQGLGKVGFQSCIDAKEMALTGFRQRHMISAGETRLSAGSYR
jgi:hypothetical protein